MTGTAKSARMCDEKLDTSPPSRLFKDQAVFPKPTRYNPDRVLKSMPAPPDKPAIPSADEVKVGSCRQDVEPQTPVTPLSAESFMSLQNLIIQRDAHALDEMSKQNLARHLQKCTKLSRNPLL